MVATACTHCQVIQQTIIARCQATYNYYSQIFNDKLIGLPLPPSYLHETQGVDDKESAYIKFYWQQPLALLISEGISYVLNITAIYENFTEYHNAITSNLSYTLDLEAQDLCSLSHIIVTVHSENKVGMGEGIQNRIQITSESVCTTMYNVITGIVHIYITACIKSSFIIQGSQLLIFNQTQTWSQGQTVLPITVK